eukprot:5456435-Prymnesium_polylepis.1
MHVISVPNFLKLEKLLPHQELKRRTLLTERTSIPAGNILFISHQWLGWEEPDPRGEKLLVLQRVLQRLMEGKGGDIDANVWSQLSLGEKTKMDGAALAAALPHAFIWMDYLSMPQKVSEKGEVGQDKEGMDAIRSIPAYVENSTIIMILAPLLTHNNAKNADGSPVLCTYKMWRSRGWCRMEYIAAMLAKRAVPLMLVLGTEFAPEFVHPTDLLTLAAGDGSFTCCSRNHDFGNGPVPCDKGTVRAVMELMLNSKVAYLHSIGDTFAARWWESLQPWLLRRLLAGEHQRNGATVDPHPTDGQSAVAKLKQRMRWRGGSEEAKFVAETGLTLLMCAAVS